MRGIVRSPCPLWGMQPPKSWSVKGVPNSFAATSLASHRAGYRTVIDEVVQKLPELLRADLGSRDAAVRQSAEEVVAAKIAMALAEIQSAH